MMHVIIQVSADVARALHQHTPPTIDSQELTKAAKELGVLLKAMHPGAEDPLLTPYFMIEAPDSTIAEQVIARIRQCKSTEAAYLKPPDELP
ncbi:MAG: hypothetical protein BA871_09590 [Desulfuromonadales bacterium C00003096]|jgi:hypothetical protein|nr:MAG: hypothetical protein BA871_09590 [Desulfuromonadales bacterium C00003096]